MIVWGGIFLNTGGRYNPSTDSCIATSLINAPTERFEHTAVWTGSEMIIWGELMTLAFRTLAVDSCSTNTWRATSMTNAPEGAYYGTAVGPAVK